MEMNEIHVWKIDAKHFKENAFLNSYLIPEELNQAYKFLTMDLKHNWLVSRASLRFILADYLNVEPIEIKFSKEHGGKPYIEGSPIFFNISHSQNHILIALSLGRRVGIDCEVIREGIEIEAISRDYFSPMEYEYINSVNISERLQTFYRCWTRKEAFVKAIGKGMSFPFSDFTISIEPDVPARIIHINSNMYDPSQWTLGDINGAGVPAAFAIDGDAVTMRYKELKIFSPLSRGQKEA